MSLRAPAFDDLAGVPIVSEGSVEPEQLDVMGHMTVLEYLNVQTRATIAGCGAFGLDLEYPVRTGMGLFSIEHRARYLREVRLGTRFTCRMRLVDATETAVQTMTYLVDEDRGLLSSSLETVLLNVSLETRRVVRFAGDTVALLTKGLARDAEFAAWDSLASSALSSRMSHVS
ncbi:thioesterase family protein [Agrococcus sp. ARC_14]|uniref:acyl-CoA thioesterase n=1 Tax=Agrococcus sp. ARC_14 TaxID=2919927 RepID=UPI001F062BA5|nr:thioesterase family protein [Agrococcus sp. ARC_14]MCH1881391.1 thioesterase family protein [Agrococcus sp. ARC_14]